jgi:hypothetical protein
MKTMLALLSLLAVLAPQAGAQDSKVSAQTGLARTVTLGEGETAEVRVRVSGPGKNVLTVVTFPAPVREIVSAWAEKDLSVEHAGERLFLKLLASSQGHLDAILSTGRHVRLYVVPVKDEDLYDAAVLVRESQAGREQAAAGSRETKGSGALELVRAMRLGEIPPGVTARKGDGTKLFGSTDVEATLSFVYESASYRGYVVRVTNGSRRAGYELDLPRFHAEDLVLVGARNLVVDPSSFTYLYLVFWKK